MNYRVEVSEEAECDLRGIYEYIAYELQAPENAIGQLERLEKHILSLETYPERYRKYEKEPWNTRGLRILPVDNYAIFYILNSSEGLVNIMRVMYTGRNIEEQLNI